MRFTKMEGAGNDYVYVDCFQEPAIPDNLPELARRISDRHFGVGGDGLVLIRPSSTVDARMQMFNVDGSEAEMCGNALRCVAKYVYDHGIVPRESMVIETGNGPLGIDVELRGRKVNRVKVDMGEPILEAAEIPTLLSGSPVVEQTIEAGGRKFQATCVSMGNPHCVIFVDHADDELVLVAGPELETHASFPRRTNVEFVELISPTEARQRTWERGCGETWACGTGASAVCVAGVLTGVTERRVLIHLRGGDLELFWDEASNHVLMTGPAREVFSGDWPDA